LGYALEATTLKLGRTWGPGLPLYLEAKFQASISSGDCISPCEGKWLESCLTFLYNKLVLQINHGLPPVILIS